jgi:hypothetical protein
MLMFVYVSHYLYHYNIMYEDTHKFKWKLVTWSGMCIFIFLIFIYNVHVANSIYLCNYLCDHYLPHLISSTVVLFSTSPKNQLLAFFTFSIISQRPYQWLLVYCLYNDVNYKVIRWSSMFIFLFHFIINNH